MRIYWTKNEWNAVTGQSTHDRSWEMQDAAHMGTFTDVEMKVMTNNWLAVPSSDNVTFATTELNTKTMMTVTSNSQTY